MYKFIIYGHKEFQTEMTKAISDGWMPMMMSSCSLGNGDIAISMLFYKD